MRSISRVFISCIALVGMAYFMGCSSLLSVSSSASSCPAFAASSSCEECVKSNCQAEMSECFGNSLKAGAGTCGAYGTCACACATADNNCLAACDGKASVECKSCIDKYKTCRTSKCNPQCKETVITNQNDSGADAKPLGVQCQALNACCETLADQTEKSLCKLTASTAVETGCDAAVKDLQSKGKCK